jgi:hypothetical protein
VLAFACHGFLIQVGSCVPNAVELKFGLVLLPPQCFTRVAQLGHYLQAAVVSDMARGEAYDRLARAHYAFGSPASVSDALKRQ